MESASSTKSDKKIPIGILYGIAIILGLICGFSHITALQTLGLTISDIFIKIFKCISLPIIALSIIVTLSQYSNDNQPNKLWQKTIFYTISTTLIAASVACVLYRWLILPGALHTTASVSNTAANAITQNHYLTYLSSLIPENIFAPFLAHQVMGALLVSMVIGIAIRYIPDPASRQTITHFFKGAHGLFLVITGWVVKIIPLALFGFITATIVQIENGVTVAGLGRYLTVIVLANLIQGFIILPTLLKMHKIQPFKTLRAMLPALFVAFFSKSSAGTLPVTLQTIERNLNVSPKTARFVLPFCTSVNMNGCAAFIFTTVIYLMQANGAQIGLSTMILWIFIATIAAIGNAGVPMGCFFLSASLLTSMNVPINLLGLILPFYSVIDMVETALNVWSDSCVTKIIDESMTSFADENAKKACEILDQL